MIKKLNNLFFLQGKDISYIIGIDKFNNVLHNYYGKKIQEKQYDLYSNNTTSPWSPNADDGVSMDCLAQEYPSFGHSDLRVPAYQVELSDGSRVTDLKYKSYNIFKGKPVLEGLPAVYDKYNSCANEGNDYTKNVSNIDDSDICECDTLELTLCDDVANLEVVLSYTVFDKYNAIFRSVKIKNTGTQNIVLKTALSVNIDIENSDWDAVYLAGSWARERHIKRQHLNQGIFELSNARGGSGHQVNPFLAICDPKTDETHGEVFGFALLYSGNHSTRVEVDQFGATRVQMGINPATFEWILTPDTQFQTPEAMVVHSSNGFGEMSREFHDIIRNNLIRGYWKEKERPILINNWEATYFNFDEEKLLDIVKKSKDLGIELFVLDDGWFGERNSDTCSLGDWVVNKAKLPSGISGLCEKINAEGLAFGLWFEPEMISPDSDLYRAHKDWAICIPNRKPAISRSQYVLDLTRKDVCDYIIGFLEETLSSANISYVKWDMNRHVTDVQNQMFHHRYVLGLYYILENITAKFPKVLFEGCSGGGGRFDMGMLYYMPQTWTSDDTDAIERLYIQHGTSMCYPLATMGSHVTAVPNHQTHRITPLKTRGDVAIFGNFGYEFDISRISDEECEVIKEQIELCKKVRNLMHEGDFYRLISPFENNDCAWQVVSKDKDTSFVCFIRKLAIPNSMKPRLKIQGLLPDQQYTDILTGNVYGGDELMYKGITVDLGMGDFQSVIMYLSVT